MFIYDVQLLGFQDLPRFGRNLDWKMAFQHGKTLQQPLFAGSYLTDPSLTSHEICDTLKKVSQAFQGHQDHKKPTPGATSTVRGKINENKEIMMKISRVFPPGEVTFARRVFPTHNELIYKFKTLRKRTRLAMTCNFQIFKIFPGLAGISIRKWPSGMEKHSNSLCSWGCISQTQARLPARFITL